jgi:hypothetical protein
LRILPKWGPKPRCRPSPASQMLSPLGQSTGCSMMSYPGQVGVCSGTDQGQGLGLIPLEKTWASKPASLLSFQLLALLLLAILARRRQLWPSCGHCRPGLPRLVLGPGCTCLFGPLLTGSFWGWVGDLLGTLKSGLTSVTSFPFSVWDSPQPTQISWLNQDPWKIHQRREWLGPPAPVAQEIGGKDSRGDMSSHGGSRLAITT